MQKQRETKKREAETVVVAVVAEVGFGFFQKSVYYVCRVATKQQYSIHPFLRRGPSCVASARESKDRERGARKALSYIRTSIESGETTEVRA